MSKQTSFVLVSTVLALAACSQDHSMGGDDAGIVVPDSARPPDAFAYDAGPPGGNIGAACASDTDCSGIATTCIGDPQIFPNGYCTASCDTATPDSCPMGTTCQDFGGGSVFCVLTCDPSVTSRQCNGRAGYGCSTNFQFSGLCVGGCVDETDCPSGLMCDPMGGDLGAGTCFTPGASVGVACVDDTQCPMGGFCQPEAGGGWPSGSCIVPGCDVATNMGCTGDAQCVQLAGAFGPPQGYCLDGCTTSTDCRDGYACTPSAANPDRHYCAPACTTDSQCSGGRQCNQVLGTCGDPFTGTLGGQCSRRDPTTCPGGSCLSERSAGFPTSYCAYTGCGTSEPCPTGGVCTARPGTTSICLRGCTSDTDCSTTPGYACRHSDPADATSAMACVPACTMDSQCTATDFMTGAHYVCNVGTGTCALPFVGTNEGIACTSDSACVGGRCLTESAFGYPGGECVYPGCSLTTGITGVTCPTSSLCVDDGIGSADFGICQVACTPGASGTCRDGYACVGIGGSTTDGACQPACTASTCAAGHSCDGTTGLCH